MHPVSGHLTSCTLPQCGGKNEDLSVLCMYLQSYYSDMSNILDLCKTPQGYFGSFLNLGVPGSSGFPSKVDQENSILRVDQV